MKPGINSPVFFILLLFSLVSLISWLVISWDFLVDDTFISLRYAANLAAGEGVRYNPGLPPVEGFTSPLWVLLLTLPHLFFFPPLLFAKIVGLLALLVTLGAAGWFTYFFCSFLSESWRWAAVGLTVFLLAVWPLTALHTVSGMETMLYTALLTSFFCLLVKDEGKTSWLLAGVGLLTGLARPEGNLAVIIGIAALYYQSGKVKRLFLKRAVLFGYLLPGFLYWSGRFYYFQFFWPLPFFIKVSQQRWWAGFPWVMSFLRKLGWLVFGGAFWAVCSLKKIYPVALSLGSLFFFFLFPAHINGYGYRYLFPLAPLCLNLAVIGLFLSMNWLSRYCFPFYQKQLYGLLLFFGGGWLAFQLLHHLAFDFYQPLRSAQQVRAVHVALGKKLAGFTYQPGKKPLVVLVDAGAIPYYSGWTVLDSYGLVTPQQPPALLLDQSPDLVIIASRKRDTYQVVFPWEKQLLEESRKHGMEPVKKLKYSSQYYLWLLADKKSRLAAYIRNMSW